jgi:hypothetical protein
MVDRTRAGRGRIRPRIFIGGLVCPGGSLAGRGGERLPTVATDAVEGKAMLANGEPLTMGQVDFVPTAEPLLTPSREVGADGTFILTTIKPGEGAPTGTYRVRIDPMPKDSVSPPKSKRPGIPFENIHRRGRLRAGHRGHGRAGPPGALPLDVSRPMEPGVS